MTLATVKNIAADDLIIWTLALEMAKSKKQSLRRIECSLHGLRRHLDSVQQITRMPDSVRREQEHAIDTLRHGPIAQAAHAYFQVEQDLKRRLGLVTDEA